MSLNIYWDGPINNANPKYIALSYADRKFLTPEDLMLDMSLPTLMLITHIGFITEQTIKHIVARVDMGNGVSILDLLNERYAKAGETDLATYLKKFIGVTSNWPTYTKAQFLEVHGQDIPKLTSADIKKMAGRRYAQTL